MAIWDKLKDGLDKANRVAQEAIDEGKTRLDARRARQAADKAAESLGYAVFRAWESGRTLDGESLDRLARALRDHEQEAVRLERAAQEAADWRRAHPEAGGEAAGGAAGGAAPGAPASGTAESATNPTDPPSAA